MSLWQTLLNALFPKKCLSCGAFGEYICRKCGSKIFPAPGEICPSCHLFSQDAKTHKRCISATHVDGMVCGFSYKGIVKKLITNAKYGSYFSLYSPLLEKIPKEKINTLINLCEESLNETFIIPVPLYHKREKTRGFNQAEIIARYISTKTGLKIVRVVTKIKNTKEQASIKEKIKRTENIKGAYVILKPILIEGKTIIIVDDVVTTGATTNEVAKTLKAHNASRIIVFALAHGAYY